MYTICEAKLALFIALPTVYRSRGSREVRPQERRKTSPRSFKPRNARSDYSSKMPIDTAYRNTWIIHVKGVNKQFSYREQNAHSIIKTLQNIKHKIHLLATASGLRSILQRHLKNAITTPSTFFQVSVRRSDTPRLTSGADPYRRRSTLNMPSGLPSWHVISSWIINYIRVYNLISIQPSPRKPHYVLNHVCLSAWSVCPSICPTPTVKSKTEQCTTFKL